MAYRNQNNHHTFERVPSYYAGNKLYPDAGYRLDVPGRTSRRVHDGMSLNLNYGLDTTSDDVDSSPYSSPYYINGRYNSDQLTTQRGNSASVQGTKRLISVHDELDDFTKNDIQTTLEMWQGKQIKFEIPYSRKVVGNTIEIKNTDGCTGILSIYISAKDGGQPIYETAVDLCKISQDKFEHIKLYSNTVIKTTANPKGKLYVRLEIWDEISKERSNNPFNTGRKIEIAATGLDNHYECVNVLGDKNSPVADKFEYERKPSRPCIGLIYNDWNSIPVNRSEAIPTGAEVSKDGYKYGIFACTNGVSSELLIYDKEMNSIVDTNISVDSRAEEINIVQALDYIYLVDGYSPLLRIKIGDWSTYSFPVSTTDSVTATVNKEIFKQSPLGEEAGTYYFYYQNGHWTYNDEQISLSTYGITVTGIPADSGLITIVYETDVEGLPTDISATYSDARPVIAPSLICFHNNRIYLAGFRNDPNLIQISEIVSAGPDFNSYPYRAYAPNESPLATSTNRVTALVEYSSNAIVIAGQNFISQFSTDGTKTSANLEAGYLVQVSTYTDGIGVASSGDICNYGGVLYSFDPDEGIRRYSGATWQKITNNIQSLYERVDMTKPRKMWGYSNKIYLNYTDKIDGKQKCLVYDLSMNYQQYPFFQDSELPFCDVRQGNDYDLYGIHPDYPCIMKLYAEETWSRLDSPIVFERHTKHMNMPGNAADMVLKRVHNKIIANSDRWWYLGISADHHSLEPERGRDVYFRVPVWATDDIEEPVETPFSEFVGIEEDAITTVSITNLRIQAISVQEKIRCKTFRAQANLISTVFEVGARQEL